MIRGKGCEAVLRLPLGLTVMAPDVLWLKRRLISVAFLAGCCVHRRAGSSRQINIRMCTGVYTKDITNLRMLTIARSVKAMRRCFNECIEFHCFYMFIICHLIFPRQHECS